MFFTKVNFVAGTILDLDIKVPVCLSWEVCWKAIIEYCFLFECDWQSLLGLSQT